MPDLICFGHPTSVPHRDLQLTAALGRPAYPRGAILIAGDHGSGRHSARIAALAEALRQEGFAVLTLDLVTTDEQSDVVRADALRGDVAELAARVHSGATWLSSQLGLGGLPLGCIGFGAAAPAALLYAATCPPALRAVVSVGTKPVNDPLAYSGIQAATLLLLPPGEPPGRRPEIPRATRVEVTQSAIQSGHARRLAVQWLRRRLDETAARTAEAVAL